MFKLSKLPMPCKVTALILFPFFIFAVMYLALISSQPKEFAFGVQDDVQAETYIDPDQLYYFTGSIECYPQVIVPPMHFDFYNGDKIILNSVDEIRQEACEQDNRYVATIRFFVDAPTNVPYSFIFPGEFCEYVLFANGKQLAETKTFRSSSPLYPSPHVVDLPPSDTGFYKIVLYISTPIASTGTTNGTILFGSTERIHRYFDNGITASIVLLALMLVTMIFCIIQLFSMQKEKIVTSFLFLIVAYIARFFLTDSVLLARIIPHLPYEIGTLLVSLTMPVTMIALMYHEYCFFPSLFGKKALYITSALEVLPVINSLTFKAYPILNSLRYIAYIAPFVLCIYVIVKAFIGSYPYGGIFSLGLLECIAASAIEYYGRKLPITTNHTFQLSFLTFAIIEMIILAKRYATQHDSELFYTEELNRTLEAMQASENAFLNAQMKPHFLYNTLNTIADLCVTDPEKAKKLIASLKDYCSLILSIDNVDKTVPLSREMELVNAYTAIEKERFPSINFYTDFPIRMPQIDMPPLTLQPLIENAIKHGVRKSDTPGIITLRIRDSFSEVTFYISDNGAGMSQETIDKLFEQPKENKSIGVYNIDKRLKNLYKSGLSVESTPDFGTCVSFTIPKIKKSE